MYICYLYLTFQYIWDSSMSAVGIDRRLRRLRVRGRFFLLALEHGLAAGPIPGIERPVELLRSLRDVAFSGTIVNPGMVRIIAGQLPPALGLVVHLSAGTVQGSRVLASTVERAVTLGADAVSVRMSFGDRHEDRTLTDAGRVIDAAASLGLPVLAMAYPATRPGDSSTDSDRAAHAARAAAEIGASVVQTNFGGEPAGMHAIVRGCPVPVVVAGGPRSQSEEAFLDSLRRTIVAGAAGVSVGRQVFQSDVPAVTERHIADVVLDAERPVLSEVLR